MLNVVTLMGRLTAAPELKVANNGTEYCNFTIAVDRSYTAKGEEKKADFINIAVFKGTAVFVNKYFGKGDMIAVNGELQTDKYTDKDGNNRTAYKVVANNVSFCGGKSNTQGNEALNKMSAKIEEFNEIEDDGTLPF